MSLMLLLLLHVGGPQAGKIVRVVWLKCVVLSAVIDNLVKGASGQAIQNMNLIMGVPEETGLLQQAMFP